jgi:membrane-bound lytic murein transglycosylase F
MIRKKLCKLHMFSMEKKAFIQLSWLFTVLLLMGLLFIVLLRTRESQVHLPESENADCIDLMQIKERGRIDVSLGYNSLNYYILHGRPAGFQFELARYFAEFLGVELHITVTNDISEAIDLLKKGKTDIVCADLTIIPGRFGKDIAFTVPWSSTKQVLVQNLKNRKHTLVKNISELSGKTIYVPRGSVFPIIIMNACSGMSPMPYIVEVPGYGSEQLIDAVAEGKISYTVADFHLAVYHTSIYDNIDVGLAVGNEKPMGWCVRSCSAQLLDTLNKWLLDFSESRQFGYLHHRYFVNSFKSDKFNGEYFSIKTGRISPYDETIKKYSREIGWDWRLIASLIYEESHFRTDLVSPSGAFGIMQLMPETARTLGIDSASTPEEHIRAGLKLLKSMDNNLQPFVSDDNERIKFVLASYTLGEGHVLDAIALAEKYRKNPEIWENNVEYFLIMKSQKKYFMDEVVKYGYCKGKVASIFVRNILERYEHYINAFPLR